MLTKERALELLIPDFEAGTLHWRVSRYKVQAGMRAGSIGYNGYWIVTIDNRSYRVHRVLWLMFHGNWPLKEIDHIDRNKRNNAITNLRDVSRSENMFNSTRRK